MTVFALDAQSGRHIWRGGTPVHQLIASPFLGQYLIVRPGEDKGLRIAAARFAQLDIDHTTGKAVPRWLADAATRTWDVDVSGRVLDRVVLLRRPSPLGYARASWEINKGYDCLSAGIEAYPVGTPDDQLLKGAFVLDKKHTHASSFPGPDGAPLAECTSSRK